MSINDISDIYLKDIAGEGQTASGVSGFVDTPVVRIYTCCDLGPFRTDRGAETHDDPAPRPAFERFAPGAALLEEKGLAYQGHVVDMARMEHHSPEYLAINPLGVIPTLIHDGRPLHESGTICEYLDETFPDRRCARIRPINAP